MFSDLLWLVAGEERMGWQLRRTNLATWGKKSTGTKTTRHLAFMRRIMKAFFPNWFVTSITRILPLPAHPPSNSSLFSKFKFHSPYIRALFYAFSLICFFVQIICLSNFPRRLSFCFVLFSFFFSFLLSFPSNFHFKCFLFASPEDVAISTFYRWEQIRNREMSGKQGPLRTWVPWLVLRLGCLNKLLSILMKAVPSITV